MCSTVDDRCDGVVYTRAEEVKGCDGAVYTRAEEVKGGFCTGTLLNDGLVSWNDTYS